MLEELSALKILPECDAVDRRRPGRPQGVSPSLVPLLRGQPPLVLDQSDDGLGAARGIVIGSLAASAIWTMGFLLVVLTYSR